MRKQIELSGIVRNLPDISVPDGSTHEVINLRPRDGAWRPVGQKAIAASFNNVVEYYMHRINESTYVGITFVENVIKYHVVTNGVAGSLIDTDITVGNAEKCVFSSHSNVLVVSDLTNEVTHQMIYSEKSGTYTEYTGTSGNTWLPQLPPFYLYSDEYTDPEFANYPSVDGSDISITDANAFNDLLVGEYLKHKSKVEEAGYLCGTVLISLAWKLIDGSIVMQSIPQLVYASTLKTDGHTDGTMRCTTSFTPHKLSIGFMIDESVLNDIKSRFKGLIKGVNVYSTLPRTPGTEEVDTPVGVKDINEINKRKKQAGYVAAFVDPWIGGHLLRRAKKTKKIYYDVDALDYYVPDIEDDTVYFLIYQIPINEILPITYISGVPGAQKTPIKPKDLNHLSTSPTMPINQFSHHGFFSRIIYGYNQRLFFANTKTYLCKDIDPSVFCNSFGISLYSGTAYKIGFEYDIMISSKKTCTVFTGFKSQVFYHFYSDQALSKIKLQIAYDVTDMKFTPTGTEITEGVAKYFGYPDARAVEARMLITFDDGNTVRLFDTFSMTSIPELNVSVSKGRLVEKVVANLPLQTLSDNPTCYYDDNRVQASEINNTFVLPALNSYRVQGYMIGLSTNATALSQGQFGQFPMFAFTSQGIWALNIGDGEELITSIVPLSREVCNNPESIQGIDGGSVFTTDKGLYIVAGGQVIEIGVPAEGKHNSPLSELGSYKALLSNANLYEVYDYLCGSSFLDYLKNAKIAWDYKNSEIIVSDGTKGYSWVYNTQAKYWHKIVGSWLRFLNDYPVTFGVTMVSDVQVIHNLTVETTDIADYDSNCYTVHMETRPMKLSGPGLKKINRILTHGYINASNGNLFSVNLFGSPDKVKWYLLNSSNRFNAQSAMVNGRSTFSCRYFILVIGGKVDKESYFNGFEIDFEDRYDNKLR